MKKINCQCIFINLRQNNKITLGSERCSVSKDVPKNFRKFYRKTPVLESPFIKVARAGPVTYSFMKETPAQVFS